MQFGELIQVWGEINNMPIYDFKCKRCANEWEEFRSVVEKDKAWCIECGGDGISLISMYQRPHVYNYYCEELESHITGPQMRKNLMKSKGLRDEWT